jgi:dihydrofolate synthase/folylpolyglutamate synthase
MIEAGLRAAGMRTGFYISPHLVEPTERIQIAGQQVTQEQFTAAFSRVHETALGMLAAGEIDMHPTYFETVTAMAFVLFAEAKLDTVVLEVGLGGRLDATNVVNPELCVITPIDYDHQIFLGDTIQQIAAEKAGILKPGVPAVFAEQRQEAEAVLREHAQADYTLSRDWPITDLAMAARGSRFHLHGPAGALDIVCPLAGEHQVENARVAAIALAKLGVSPAGIASARWPARLELVSERPGIMIDGAHNPAGTRALAAYIRRFYSGRRVWIVYGALADKAVTEMTAILFPLADRLILTAPANSRAMPPTEIPAHDARHRPSITASIAEAISLLAGAAPEDVVFIAGSLYLAGEARALLVK